MMEQMMRVKYGVIHTLYTFERLEVLADSCTQMQVLDDEPRNLHPAELCA